MLDQREGPTDQLRVLQHISGMEERMKDQEGGRVKQIPLVGVDWMEWMISLNSLRRNVLFFHSFIVRGKMGNELLVVRAFVSCPEPYFMVQKPISSELWLSRCRRSVSKRGAKIGTRVICEAALFY